MRWGFVERAIRTTMWRFFEGVSQPPATKKKSETQIGAVAREEKR